jgi:hypothetical protein
MPYGCQLSLLSLRVYNNLKGKTLKPDTKRWIYDGIKGNLEDDTNWNTLQGEDNESFCIIIITTFIKMLEQFYFKFILSL